MSTVPSPRATRATLLGALVAGVLLAPVPLHAQLGGLGSALGSRILRGRGSSAGGFPPGFSDPRYAITTARLDAILRGIASHDAAVARYARAQSAQEAQEARRSQKAERDAEAGRQKIAPTMAYVACVAQANQTALAMPASDARRRKVEALQQHQQAYGAQLEQRTNTGQPIDTATAVRRLSAMTDSLALLTIGRRCPPMPKEMLEGDSPDATPSAPDAPQGPDDVGTFVAREAHLDAQQMGVTCDKLVVYFGALQRHVEPAGFDAAELDALRARGDALRQHVDGSLCSGMP